MRLALTGPDQLRQRVAWALHNIWVVSAVEVDNARAIVNYKRILLNNAFGNYRNLMRDMTLNPAMGRYLNMLNNRSQASTGGVFPMIEYWNLSLATPLTAGSHTIQVRAIGSNTGLDATVSGSNTSVLQGSLTVQLLKL